MTLCLQRKCGEVRTGPPAGKHGRAPPSSPTNTAGEVPWAVAATSRGHPKKVREAPVVWDAQEGQVPSLPADRLGCRLGAVPGQPACSKSSSGRCVCQARRNKNVLSKRFNFPVSTGKSTDNGKQHKKHIHERLLFKTS